MYLSHVSFNNSQLVTLSERIVITYIKLRIRAMALGCVIDLLGKGARMPN
jgi:hypothetical protein